MPNNATPLRTLLRTPWPRPAHQGAATPARRMLLAAASACAVLALLPGCASLGLPHDIRLDEAELQRRLKQAFPMQRRLLELIDLQLLQPRLRLLPEHNRLAVTLGLRSEDRLWRSALQGELAFEAGLRIVPADATLRLSQVRVLSLTLDQAGEQAAAAPGREAPSGLPARLARVVAEQLLEDLSLYQLPAERLAQLRQAGLQLGDVRITGQGIRIGLQPAR